MGLITDFRYAFRSLVKARGLAITVIVTLALGIGANAAIFSVVRGVLLRPLVNRDEARLIYIRQSAQGLGSDSVVFSVPEIRDLRSRITTLTDFGEFSTIPFTMVGLGEPRVVRAGVVNGSYFDVMGLRPVLGRLIGPADDGPNAAGVAVLTHRFWTTTLNGDRSVIGKTVRFDERSATIVGVLEPSVPYPAETEVMANIVTSPHHLSATMVTGRVHRMTELFGRLKPGADLEGTLAQLRTVHASMVAANPEAYPKKGDFRIDAVPLRDQIASPARTVLLVLMAASGLVFIIACSNVANLILARSVRRESELAVRATLGATAWALRRTLLAESLLLCGAGAILGVLLARPMVALLARYAARFSVRALDLTVDASLLWVGVGLALLASILLAFVPRLPTADAGGGLGASSTGVRITSGTNRRLRIFAVTQIAASFVLLAGAGMLLTTLMALQATRATFETRNVLSLVVPVSSYGRTPEQVVGFYKETMRRIAALPGVEQVSVGTQIPWREGGNFGPGFQLTGEGTVRASAEDDPRAQFRTISPGFFASLGVPILAGRDFTDNDRADGEKIVIISQTLAQRLFPGQDAVNKHIMWTDPVMQFIEMSSDKRRVVGVVGDIDDENIVPGPAMNVYHPLGQAFGGGRFFVHTKTDPYPLVAPITRIIRDLSADTPVEQAATLADVKAEVLAPNRLNALVFGTFAGVALLIAVVGVAGVLAFSVSARTREFGIRLAIGSEPRHLLTGVLGEGAVIAAAGILTGIGGGFLATRLIGGYIQEIHVPGFLPILGAALLLVAAAIVASLIPAARASRLNVIQALRAD